MLLHIQAVCWRTLSECTKLFRKHNSEHFYHLQYMQACLLLFHHSLEMTGLTDACVEDLCAAVRASKTLKSLELRNNSLTDSSVPALIQIMQDSHSMQEMK